VTSSRPVVAAFDLDGTVTRRDCVVPFLRRVGGTAPIAGRLALDARNVVPALARRDRDRLKATAARAAFTGRPYADVEAAGREFAAFVHHAWLRPDVLERIGWHRDRDHDVVLVSASFGVYARPLGETLDASDVVATELVVDADGRCTGELLDGNCRGAAKVRRLHRWLDEDRGGREAVEVWAYGDSPGDRDLLTDADHAVWARHWLEPSP
jgi:phosphatidylglycerophosphatase C